MDTLRWYARRKCMSSEDTITLLSLAMTCSRFLLVSPSLLSPSLLYLLLSLSSYPLFLFNRFIRNKYRGKIQVTGTVPPSRFMHSAVLYDQVIFSFLFSSFFFFFFFFFFVILNFVLNKNNRQYMCLEDKETTQLCSTTFTCTILV